MGEHILTMEKKKINDSHNFFYMKQILVYDFFFNIYQQTKGEKIKTSLLSVSASSPG